MGIVIAFWLFFFHSVTSFGISKHEQTSAGLVGFSVSLTFYVLSIVKLIPLEVAAGIALAVSFG